MEKYHIDVPVLLIFFQRPQVFSKVFNQVKKARPSILFLYQDGPRNEFDINGIIECRKIAEDINWDCKVYKLYQEKNFGCDPSEFISQKWAFSIVDRCIILEDDDVPSISFFYFCKELLEKYKDDERISIISGINYEEITSDCPFDYFFSQDVAIWGWASWKRVIDKWEEHYDFLNDEYHVGLMLENIKKRNFKYDLDLIKSKKKSGKAFYEFIMIADHCLNSRLSIVPKMNMINNIGMINDSTHFSGNLKTQPAGFRTIFTMKRFEINFPLSHPKYIIENIAYRNRISKILGYDSFLRIKYRLYESRILRLVYDWENAKHKLKIWKKM